MKVSEEDNNFSEDNSILKMIYEFYFVQKTDVKKYKWKKLWKTRSSGTSSPSFYYKEHLYFTGGGDGKLHVIDSESGVYNKKYLAPKYKENTNLFFSRATIVDEKIGRIYTTDYRNVYCIEPVAPIAQARHPR